MNSTATVCNRKTMSDSYKVPEKDENGPGGEGHVVDSMAEHGFGDYFNNVKNDNTKHYGETKSLSFRSKASSAALKSKAKLEAAKLRMRFAEKEAELARRELELRIQKDLLITEREVAEAEAALKILDDDDDDDDELLTRSVALSGVGDEQDTKTKVNNYLERCDVDSGRRPLSQVDLNLPMAPQPGVLTSPQEKRPNMMLRPEAVDFVPRPQPISQNWNRQMEDMNSYPRQPPILTPYTNVPLQQEVNDDLLVTPPPPPEFDTPAVVHQSENMISELSKFMLKKDLIKYRLGSFSDTPSTYLTWKTSFRQVMTEVDATANEEMDLLLRHLGPESTKVAQAIRTANIHSPERGLKRIWDRLEEEYGRPEVIQNYLYNRLSNFPRITNKDSKKLFDLFDLLTEMEAIKENPMYSSLLSYLDTPAGINPIVNKLPFHLQERWVGEAVKYKSSHDVISPPFPFLIKFIHRLARVKNDPCLEMQHSHETKHTQDSRIRQVACKKTDVEQVTPQSGITKICPIQITP